MTFTISKLTEDDIPGAISAIQEAFKEDPYNLWIYNNQTRVRFSLPLWFSRYLSIVTRNGADSSPLLILTC